MVVGLRSDSDVRIDVFGGSLKQSDEASSVELNIQTSGFVKASSGYANARKDNGFRGDSSRNVEACKERL